MAITTRFAAALLAGTALLAACNMTGNGQLLIETDDSSDEDWSSKWSGEPFDTITLAGPDNLTFVAGGDHAVSASGDVKALETLQFKVQDGELRIRRKSSGLSMGSKGEAAISVSAPSLRGLTLAGSGAAKVDKMEGDSIKLTIAGSGDADIAELVTKDLEGSIAGSGSIKLAGSADTSDISIAGSGSVMGEGFTSQSIDISIAGSGDVTMASDGEVDASLMGSGDVTIKGKAKCKSKAMGSGTISCG